MSDHAEKRGVGYVATSGFFADAMLGSLARWMRALGYDVLYENSIDDKVLAERAEAEGRIILTRDVLLIERRKARSRSFFIKGNDIGGQLRQVVEAFPLGESLFLSRCLRCNLRLEDIEKTLVKGRVAPWVYDANERFSQCAGCGRVYWAGTHAKRMAEAIKKFLDPQRLTGPLKAVLFIQVLQTGVLGALMTDGHITVFMTTAGMDEAASIGRKVVEERLAACCNIIPGVRSIYAWKGAIHDSAEVLCVFKTRSSLFDRLSRRIKELHGYEVPEIVAVDIKAGLAEYLAWIDDSTMAR